jgi:hypothetical protein
MLKNRKAIPLILLAALNLVLIIGSIALTSWVTTYLPLLVWLSLSLICRAVILFIYLTNDQYIAQHHIHTPHFKSRQLNELFGLMNSMPLDKLSKQTAGPVFEIIKEVMRFRIFSLRGLEKLNLELAACSLGV